MCNLISIDQSLRATGITIWTSKDGYIYKLMGAEKTKDTKCPTIDYTRRIIDLKNEIKRLCLDYNIEKGIIEGAAFGGNGKLYDLGGLGHSARIAMIESGVEFIVIPPKTAKKYFTSSGNASKQEMIDEAHKRNANITIIKKYGKGIVDYDDNVVDSFAFMQFLQDYCNGTLPLEYLGKVEFSKDL